ncbi:hypothetical protein [Nioella sp.]|uniref:hypothetical protein n=1 Tax=Nioella sp. TaxID=1912091 RepID=UPI003B51F486
MWPFNKPKEVRAAVAALEIEAEKYKEAVNALFGVEAVLPQVKAVIEDQADKTVHSIKSDGISPRALVHLIISNIVYERLTSGALHVYRGTLSKEGSDMLKVFRFSSEVLVTEGLQSAAEAEAGIEDLEKQIKGTG